MSQTLDYTINANTDNAVKNVDNLTDALDGAGNAATEAGDKVSDGMGTAAEGTKKATGGIKGIGAQLGQLGGPIGSVIQGVKGVIQVFNILIMNPIGAIIAAIALALITLYKAFTSTNDGADKMEQIMSGLGAIVDVLRDRFLQLAGAIGKLFTGDFTGAMEDAKGAISGVGDEIVKEAKAAADLQAELQALEDMEKALIKTRATQNRQLAAARLLLEDENASFADRKKALDQVKQSEIALAKQEEEMARRRYEAIKAQNALSDSSDEALQREAEAYAAMEAAAESSFRTQKKLAKQMESLQKEEDAKRKAAAEEYKKNLDDVRKVSEDLRIALIEDDRKAEIEKAKLQTKGTIDQINELKVSAAKRKELRAQALEVERITIKDINDKYDQTEEDKRKADEEKKKNDAKATLDKELADIQDQLNKKYALLQTAAVGEAKTAEELAAKLAELEAKKNQELIDQLKAKGQSTVELEAKFAQDAANKRFQAEKEASDKQKKLDADALKAKLDYAAAVSGALSAIAGAVGENTAFAKAAALASAIIDTYAGATKALAEGAGTPIGYINAAAIIATGLANVRKILSTETPKAPNGQGGGSVSMPSVGPSVEITGQSMSPNAQVAAQLGKAFSKPPRAYVVGSDVSSQQSLDRKIVQNATLGE
jgi:hypothetical protein